MSIDHNEYRRVLGHFPTGVTVVTGSDGTTPAGMAIGSFSSVSLDPPLVMFCPGRTSATWQQIKETGAFCVNVLAEDQVDLCAVFASKAEDKFDGVHWLPGTTGSPVLPDVLAVIDCEIHAILDGGDHDIVVGLVKDTTTADPEDERGPLLFFRGGYGRYESL